MFYLAILVLNIIIMPNYLLTFPIMSDKTERIRELNDQLRVQADFTIGQIMLTIGVQSLEDNVRAQVLRAVRDFDDFSPDNDPYQEHDFGSVEVQNEKYFFKIDLYEEMNVKHKNNLKLCEDAFSSSQHSFVRPPCGAILSSRPTRHLSRRAQGLSGMSASSALTAGLSLAEPSTMAG